MNVFDLIFFSLALNMDALGVGISYGIRKIKLPLLSVVIICLISMASLSISMLAGNAIQHYISKTMSQHIGGGILVLIGTWAIYQYFDKSNPLSDEDNKIRCISKTPDLKALLQLRLFGILIQVLKDPQIADADKSGTISTYESLLLGMALALDSIGAGVAISLLGYDIAITTLYVGLCQFAFTYCGVIVGSKMSNTPLGRQIAVLPGLLLIMIGIIRFY
ncbi:MAG: sporulation membrane protein YtaF [Bacillota bacterium]